MIKFNKLASELAEMLTGDYFYIKITIVTIFFSQAIRRLQSGPLQLYFNKHDALMSEFTEKSNIRKLVFKPFFICISSFLQFIVYLLLESLYRLFAQPETE